MSKQMGTKKSGGKKFNWKKLWSKLRLNRKTDSGLKKRLHSALGSQGRAGLKGRWGLPMGPSEGQHAPESISLLPTKSFQVLKFLGLITYWLTALKGETRPVEENLPSCSRIDVKSKGAGTSKEVEGDVIDIHEIDKDRIRTTCKEALENPPKFPTREEVKEKIENAHKYYGITCMYNHYVDAEDPNDKEELQPSWYYILERPLVEQYVLMNNYIRKLSVMASLKKEQSGVEEEPAIEEEASSISSLSDYEGFAPDSKIAAKLKELKKLGAKDSLPSQIGASRLEQELMELKKSANKSEERTVRTNEYTIVIREPARVDGHHNTIEVLPSSSNAIEFEQIERRLEVEGIEDSDLHSSGDHLPDMSDFDLSHNLINGPVEMKTGFRRQSYYHWQGNSTPTKTALLNMDCQPPVRPRAPGTARDFLSFRSLSLSSEFMDSCRDYSVAFAEECRSGYLKDLSGPGDTDDDLYEGCVSSGTQAEHTNCSPFLSLTWEDPTKNCRSALADPEENSVVERAALISDYNRQCGDQAIDNFNDTNSEEMYSADVPSVPASHIFEYEQSPYELEDDDVLRTSVSQMDTYADCAESESASSMETQILAKPTNLE